MGARDVEVIEAALVRGRSTGLLLSGFLLLCAVGAAARFIHEENYGVAALMVVMLGGVAALIYYLSRFSDPRRSEAVQMLLNRPQSVRSVGHGVGRSSGGGMTMHFVYAETPAGRAVMRVDRAGIVPLARALANHCKKADISVPGFERPAEARMPG
jgi:hypothetical protein